MLEKVYATHIHARKNSEQRLIAGLHLVQPKDFDGKPTIREARISIKLILGFLAASGTIKALLDDYPGVELIDSRARFAYTHALCGREHRRGKAHR